jgi:hypothetical protein
VSVVEGESPVAGHRTVKINGAAGDDPPERMTPAVEGVALKFISQPWIAQHPVQTLGDRLFASELDQNAAALGEHLGRVQTHPGRAGDIG